MNRFSSLTPIVILASTLIALTSAIKMPASAASFSPVQNRQARTLTFADRVAYQYAIEEVYWRHRIWPKENPGLKPSLDEVMSPAQIQKKVVDYLRDSQLLADQLGRPIIPEQLQAEMDRMAQHTRQADVLGELFAALENDPLVIAECLARSILSRRLIGNTSPKPDSLAMSAVLRVPATLYKLPDIVDAESCVGDSWQPTAMAPGARDSHTVVWTGSEMIIWGGYPGLLTGGRYNPSTDSWLATTITDAPDPRVWHTAVWTGSEMIIWGGDSDYYPNYVNSGGRYSPGTDTWTATTLVNAPTGRYDHTAVWTGSEMIVWGGFSGFSGDFNSGGRYNPRTNSWTPTSLTDAPASRSGHTALWTGTEMIIWGGGGASYYNSGGKYNPNTDSWTATSTSGAPGGRDFHTAVWTGTEMIIWGGEFYDGTSHYLNTGGRYNPNTNSWSTTSGSNAPTSRAGHTAVWTGSRMIVWGGYFYDGIDNYLNTGARYNPSSDSWTPTTVTGAPDRRVGHTVVWTGTEMIVWGGVAENYVSFNTGGRYNPTNDSWLPTITTNVPKARSHHTAVWTGSEMIVWGGDSPSYTNTGGRYYPSTDTWTTTTIINAPDGRDYHSAIWSGSEMIVWGGYNNNDGALDTGGKYNPIADNWAPTATTNAPAARQDHTAVWTGSEMIIWGGDWAGRFNSGGKYNPGTNTWIATSTVNAPDGRSYHTAVWTGSEMIIWGGFGMSGYLNSGGRYNSNSNSWTSITTFNGPSGRRSHTAVWTGSEMIVWGGSFLDNGFPQYLNTGGRYNPSSNSWMATNTNNAPDSRDQHTVVWTGSEMIVWGGYNAGAEFNTGGRYNPSSDGWIATDTTSAPDARDHHTAVWTGSKMIIWGGVVPNGVFLNTGGSYCAQMSTPVAQSAVSRKTHGSAGIFDINLPMSGTSGVECRNGNATKDYTMVVTFSGNVTVNGNPQAAVTAGVGTVGSGGMSNGGMVTISGNVVTVPLTNVANAQTINVSLNGVNGSTNIVIPMRLLIGDVNGNGIVNASDVAQTKSRVGQGVSTTNFRSDVNANGSINASDVSIVKGKVGTGVP